MLNLTLALELRDAGLSWHPKAGDRFMVTNVEMVDDLFHLADMVIEARRLGTGTVFAFNGTTEWALDSVEQDEVVWLPREDQLRAALGDSFRALHRQQDGSFTVTVRSEDGAERSVPAPRAEDALAGALLIHLTGS